MARNSYFYFRIIIFSKLYCRHSFLTASSVRSNTSPLSFPTKAHPDLVQYDNHEVASVSLVGYYDISRKPTISGPNLRLPLKKQTL